MKINCHVLQVGSLKADLYDLVEIRKIGYLSFKCHFQGKLGVNAEELTVPNAKD